MVQPGDAPEVERFAIPDRFRMPNGEKQPTFIQVDFGLVDVAGRIEGRLVELQAFPSLYGFQPGTRPTHLVHRTQATRKGSFKMGSGLKRMWLAITSIFRGKRRG